MVPRQLDLKFYCLILNQWALKISILFSFPIRNDSSSARSQISLFKFKIMVFEYSHTFQISLQKCLLISYISNSPLQLKVYALVMYPYFSNFSSDSNSPLILYLLALNTSKILKIFIRNGFSSVNSQIALSNFKAMDLEYFHTFLISRQK